MRVRYLQEINDPVYESLVIRECLSKQIIKSRDAYQVLHSRVPSRELAAV